MSAIPWESEEERNYICMDHIVNVISGRALRGVFKQEWNNRYQASFGAWDDTSSSGNQLFHREKTRNRPNKPMLQSKFNNGDTNEWDCTVLFDAILYSNSIGLSALNPKIKNAVDELRNIRNTVKHIAEGKLLEADFQTMCSRVENAFNDLGLPTNEIKQIKVKRNLYKSFQVFPPEPSHELVYRSEMIKEVSLDLQKMRTDNNGKLTYFYISGNPGSGKSQFARQVCENVYNSVDWQTEATFVMTLNAKDLKSLLYSYEDFCRSLNCSENVLQSIMNSAKSEGEKIKDLRSQITTRIRNWKRWWLIVDNVENLGEISHLLPQTGDVIWNNGQIILTTQNATFIPPDRDNNLTKQISLSPGMNGEECRKLLSSLSKTDPNDPLLSEIAKQLDYQPLAMAAAGVYLRRVKESNKQFSWPDYLTKLENGKRNMTEKQLRSTNSAYGSTMSTAVLLAVEKCAEDSILKHTFDFLSLVSFEDLPLDIIVNYIQQQSNDSDTDEICLLVQQCSLFLPAGNKNRDVRLHRVVHDAVKIFCDNKEPGVECPPQTDVLSNVVRSLYRFKQRNDMHQLTPHLKAFYAAVKKLHPKQEALYLINLGLPKTEIYEIYQFFGNALRCYFVYELSKEFLNASFQIYLEEKLTGPVIYNSLGAVYLAAGELKKAQEYYQRALDIDKKLLGDNHLNTAASYNNLGIVYRDSGELKNAQIYFQRALNIREKLLGQNHPDTATSYNSLGAVYYDAGELKKAQEYHQRALDIREELLGHNHPDTATAYNNLGAVYQDAGELKKAQEYLQRALYIREELLGHNHPSTAASYNNLGAVYHAAGELKKAQEYHQRALDIREKLLGHNHSDTASSYNNLGIVYRDAGELKKAQEYHQQALDIDEKLLSHNHPDTASSYNNLGAVYHAGGELKKAQEYWQRALDIREKLLGHNHHDTATSYSNLGIVYCGAGELKKAQEYHQRALDIRTKLLSLNHPDTAASYNNLGAVYQAAGELKKAQEYLQRSLDICEKLLGYNHPDTASSYNNLGAVYQAAGELKKAQEYHQRALDIREKLLGHDHPDTAASYNNLGRVYHDAGELRKAQEYHQRALDIREKLLGHNHTDTASSYKKLGAVYEDAGELEKARECYQRALDIRVKL